MHVLPFRSKQAAAMEECKWKKKPQVQTDWVRKDSIIIGWSKFSFIMTIFGQRQAKMYLSSSSSSSPRASSRASFIISSFMSMISDYQRKTALKFTKCSLKYKLKLHTKLQVMYMYSLPCAFLGVGLFPVVFSETTKAAMSLSFLIMPLCTCFSKSIMIFCICGNFSCLFIVPIAC